jgi:hypothetical protein
MSARQAFAQWREDRRRRRSDRRAPNVDKQDTSVGESKEQAAEREQAAKRTMADLNAARDAERKQANNVEANEEY